MQPAKQAIANCEKALIVGHVSPDADCISSMLVMYSVLNTLGKSAKMMLPPETVAKKFMFMFELVSPSSLPACDESFDLVIALDTALRNRINLAQGFDMPSNARICNIDHHLGNERYGQINWIDSDAASTSQMVFLLVEALGAKLTPEQASLLYAGIHGDTCGFSLQGTNVATLTIATSLAELGADIGPICQKLHRSMPISEFKLMQLVYANTRTSPSGRIAWSTISCDELDQTGCGPDDIDEQVSVPRSIDGVKIAILFSERPNGRIRMNIRSEDNLNILPLAKALGGGGHAHAAGVITKGEMSATVNHVVARVEHYLAQTLTQAGDVEPADACKS